MNNINLILLKLLLNKSIFNKYNKILDLEFIKNNNKPLFKIFLSLFKLHEQSTENITLQNLQVFFYTLYPNTKDDERHLIDSTFDVIDTLEVDEALVIDYLKKQHEQSLANKIAVAAVQVGLGNADMGTVLNILQENEFSVDESVEEEGLVTTNLEELVNQVFKAQGLRWRLNTLNKALGSLRKGDFGFIFARPETGKTTFLASETVQMAQQAKKEGLGPILWLNNEEQGIKVMLRVYQAYFGVSLQDLATNLNDYQDQFQEDLGGHFIMYDRAQFTKAMIESLCKRYNPSLIIFDQIDKIVWMDSERNDLKLKAVYQWARELAKKYGAFIGVCQAGGTGEGKKYLTMNDVDSSHTAKQGEADFILGIGTTNKDEEEFVRGISICKNKLTGDIDSIADMRHAKVPVLIKPTIARYEDMIKL